MPVAIRLGVVVVFIGLFSSINLIDAQKKDYDGFAVMRSFPQTEAQLEHLRVLMSKSRLDDLPNDDLQFWTEPIGLNASVDVVVSPDYLDHYLRKLSRWSIPTEEIIPNLGEEIAMSKTGADLRGFRRDSVFFNETLRAELAPQTFHSKYQRYSAMEAKLNQLEQLDKRVSLEVIGKSYESRNIYLVKVSNNFEANKPVVLFDAGHHAREWVTHSTIMYLLDSLIQTDIPRVSPALCTSRPCREETLERPSLDLEKFDYWFIPVVNPDGYEYTHTTDRLWRKTRSRGRLCIGVDPNRNYDFHWRESGASMVPCSDIYAGPYAHSEPEVRAVASVMDNNKDRIKMYISLHSYSQMILAPYGYGQVIPHNYRELEEAANAFISSTSRLRRTNYQFGVVSILLYPASGGSDDYAHGAAGIRYAFTIELPDTGKKGFVMPDTEIIPIAHETLLGLSSMIATARV